jgi:hypothetical protein
MKTILTLLIATMLSSPAHAYASYRVDVMINRLTKPRLTDSNSLIGGTMIGKTITQAVQPSRV